MLSKLFSKFPNSHRNVTVSLIISLVLYLCTLGGLFIRGIWPLEGGISFLPHVLLVVVLWLAIFVILSVRSWQAFALDTRRLVYAHVVLLVMFLVTVLVPIQQFAYTRPVTAPETASAPTIRVVFFNKLLTNDTYAAISNEIDRLKPDIIGFAEFGSDERTKIEALKKYRYYLITKCNCHRPNSDSALFSLLPMRDPEVLRPDRNGFPVAHATLLSPQRELSVYVAHPRSPITPKDLIQRNYELDYLTTVLQKENNKPVIVMGDFNVTPWSPTYKHFLNNLPHLVDVSAGTGLNFTWSYLPFISNHIDHILVSNYFHIKDFQVGGRFGSDHSLIYTDIQL